MLSSSLGGNACTAVICACSPASRNYEETCGTLKFASFSATIVNKANSPPHPHPPAPTPPYPAPPESPPLVWAYTARRRCAQVTVNVIADVASMNTQCVQAAAHDVQHAAYIMQYAFYSIGHAT